MNAALLQEVDVLSLEDKLALLDRIWNSVAALSASLPVPASHIAELDRRDRRISSGEATYTDFDSAMERVRRKVGR
jgi:putative addiction module component (TIGR02574 family)